MIKALVGWFIPNHTDTKDKVVRQKHIELAGVTGIICNALLFIVKLVVGTVMGSIAVISDGFNNLSDMGSSLISVFGARISGRNPDTDHPYGHGRAEYISALIIAFLIIMVGVELLKSSFSKLFTPQSITINATVLCLLVLSVLVKLWMWSYNRYLGKKIDSDVLLATSKDSVNDVMATTVIIISAVLGQFVRFPLDGIMGILVSALIFYTGFDVARITIDKLLGQHPEESVRCKIEEALLENPCILGMHSLMVHDYGAGRKIASVHAEVPQNMSLVEAHDIIDLIERRILEEVNVDIVIHIDPVPENSARCFGLSTINEEDEKNS